MHQVKRSTPYTLKKNVLKRFQNQGNAVCYACGQPLKLDDKVVSRNNTARRYHKKCFENLHVGDD
jgi:hypothetical protein